jgi:hypothetical protein
MMTVMMIMVLVMKTWPRRTSLIWSYLFSSFVMEALTDTSIISWNIRGAHNNNARRHLKDMIRKYSPTFMAIYETHIPFARLSSFWTNIGYTPVHIIEANGHSGGIWLLKHSATNITTTILDLNQHSITFSIKRGTAITHEHKPKHQCPVDANR